MTETARVTLPNGRQVTVKGPDRETVLRRIDQLRAENPATPIPEARGQAIAEVARGLDNSPNFATQGAGGLVGFVLGNESRRAGAGAAVNNVIENAQRLGAWAGEKVGIVTPEARAELESRLAADDEAQQALFREQPTDANIGRMGAEAGMFYAVPGGREGGLLTRAITSGTAAAATAAATTGAGEDVWDRAMVGGLFGLAAPIMVAGVQYEMAKYGPALANATSRVLGKYSPVKAGQAAPQMVVDGQFTDDALRILRQNNLDPSQLDDAVARQLQRDGLLTPEQAERFNYFKQFDPDYRPTLAEVTQAGDDFMRQQELAKGSNALARQIAGNEDVIERNVRRQVEDIIGVPITDPVTAGIDLQSVAFARINAADDAVNAAYKAVREAIPDEKVIKPDGLVAALRRFQKENAASGGFVEAVMGDLESRGVISMGGNGLRVGRINAETAEEVRKYINELSRGDPAKRTRLAKAFKDALDNDVEAAAGADYFRVARAKKAALERSLERARRTYRSAGRDTLLERLVEDRIPDRNLAGAILTADASDVRQMMAFLQSGSADEIAAGTAAIDKLRGAIVWDMYQKALVGKAEGGARMFSGHQFRQQLNKHARLLPDIFSPEQQSWMAALGRVGELRIPKTGTQQGFGPSAQGMRVVGEQLIDFGDQAVQGHFGLLRKLLTIGQESRDIIRGANPQAATADALARSQRPVPARPMAGSVGAVTADRLPAESEESGR